MIHRMDISEIYDLKNDPNEFENLWNNPAYKKLQAEYVLKCFNHAIECNQDCVLGNTGMF